MKVTIEINCADGKDLLLHLSVIRQQIKSELNKQVEPEDTVIEDSTVYGDHTIIIKP